MLNAAKKMQPVRMVTEVTPHDTIDSYVKNADRASMIDS